MTRPKRPLRIDLGLWSVDAVRDDAFFRDQRVRRHGVLYNPKGVFVVFGKRRVLGLVTVLALALLLAACGGGGDGSSSNQQSSAPSTQSSSTATTANSGVREIEIILDDFSFGPQEIRVKSGEKVRLVIRNQGSVAHDWYVDELDLSSPLIQPGQSASFEFTAGAAGRYEAICTEPGHEALGMVGTLIIE